MVCPRCGKKLKKEWNLCPECGCILVNNKDDDVQSTERQNTELAPVKKKTSLLKRVFSFIGIFFLGIGLLAMCSSEESTGESDITIENIDRLKKQ